ncbi:histone-lysine N-methyltransferase SETMAR [Nephila pilipes]|uniref:Histone-lysine N-methyltransferase SETMAR n=1 Tax=Nephila pilipes TaxID=299642 RepID=A0A8X6IJ50_NEPPI|nr:histone-lysine N-methyltransferase SETMAR [Nephila pilipes]
MNGICGSDSHNTIHSFSHLVPFKFEPIMCNFGFVDSVQVFFDVKDAPRTDRPNVENVDKISEIIEVDQHVSSCIIAQELKIDHEGVINHSHKAGFEKKLDVWLAHQLTPQKN